MKFSLCNQPGIKTALLCLDILVFVFSLFAALVLGYNHTPIAADRQTAYFTFTCTVGIVAFGIYIISFYLNNLYKRHIIITRYRQSVLISKSLLVTCIVVLLFTVFCFHSEIATFGRFFFAILFSFCFALSIFFRVFIITPLLKTSAEKDIAHHNLILVGRHQDTNRIINSFVNDPYNHFKIIGIIDDSQPVGAINSHGKPQNESIRNLGHLAELQDLVHCHNVDEILITAVDLDYQSLINIVESCLAACPVVRVHSDFLKIVVDKIEVEKYSGIPVIMFSQGNLEHLNWRIKRFIDILISASALIVLSPLFALIAMGIKLSSHGPIFFRQVRIGKDGKPFDFYKFRSMHVGRDSNEHQEFVKKFIKGSKPGDKREAGTVRVFKMVDDPRIFKFGSFLRQTSLDEFPQFFNVLKGDMSLVGPRPCLPYEWECYEDWHKNRMNVLPGCTGMWQALGRSSVSFEEMVVLDLYYISNMTILLDIQIILMTFPVIFLGKGGY